MKSHNDYTEQENISNTSPSSLSAKSITRIIKEYKQIQSDPDPFWCAYPLNVDDPFDWHFTLKGSSETDFEGGLYHGRIVLPPEYPFAPPTIWLLTPSGKFKAGKKICLNISNFHPETWHPLWGIRTILTSLHVFFSTTDYNSISSLDSTSKIRKILARASVNWQCTTCKKSNKELVNEMCPIVSDESARQSKNFQEMSDQLRIYPSQDIDTDNEVELSTIIENSNLSQKLEEEKTKMEKANTDQNTNSAYTKRLRPQHEPSSFFRQLFSKPSDNLDLILIAIDVLLGICFIVLINFLSHLILDLSRIF